MSLQTNVSNVVTAIATAIKQLRIYVNGNDGTGLTRLTTTSKASLVDAINEVRAGQSGSAGINDGVTGTTSTWSSSKIDTEIDNAVAGLVASAPGTLNTLDELAAALGDDAAFSTTVTTALGNRVRVDTAQTLTTGQQAQARTNIGAASAADLTQLRTDMGDHNANFVTTFEAGLA